MPAATAAVRGWTVIARRREHEIRIGYWLGEWSGPGSGGLRNRSGHGNALSRGWRGRPLRRRKSRSWRRTLIGGIGRRRSQLQYRAATRAFQGRRPGHFGRGENVLAGRI